MSKIIKIRMPIVVDPIVVDPIVVDPIVVAPIVLPQLVIPPNEKKVIRMKPHQDVSQKIKLNITKKITDKLYKITTTNQILKPLNHDPIDIPNFLELAPFFYQNGQYWVDETTELIFIFDDLQSGKIEPVGQFIKIDTKESNNMITYLSNRKIKWFVGYDYDVLPK